MWCRYRAHAIASLLLLALVGCDDGASTQADATDTVELPPDGEVSEPERCNGLDDDADGEVDEGCDDDGDGFCDAALGLASPPPPICAQGGGDCDDANDAVHPGAVEVCNDTDDNCTGGIDEVCDADGDGYCTRVETLGGSTPAACALGGGDCDDADPSTNPSASEACNGRDDNCVDGADEGCDDDGDGYCDVAMTLGAGPVAVCPLGGGDCDDTERDVNPAGSEVCNDLDDDCSGAPDEGCDDDGDGFCDAMMAVASPLPSVCAAGVDDCDDGAPAVHPGQSELCDDLDNNCDGAIDEGCNPDGDLFCDADATTLGMPAVCAGGGGDCDETRDTVYPGAPDGCGIDWNCDGLLLAQDGGMPVVVSETWPDARSVDMAFDGAGSLAAVWVESRELNEQLVWARFDLDGNPVVGPTLMTPATEGVSASSIVWSTAQSAWAVAFTRETRVGFGSVFLGYVDSAGTWLAPPIEIASDTAGGSDVRLQAGSGDVLGVFYYTFGPMGSVLAFRGHNSVSGSTTARVDVMTQSVYSVGSMSYAVHGDTFWVVRHRHNPQMTPAHAYHIAAANEDGTLHLAESRYDYGGFTSVNEDAAFAVLGGQLYLLFTGYLGPGNGVLAAPLDTVDGTPAAAATLLVGDADADYAAYPVAVEDGPDSFALLYRDDDLVGSWYLERFSTITLASLAPQAPLWFDRLRSDTGRQPRFFLASGRYYALNTLDDPTYFFSIYGIEADGTPHFDITPAVPAQTTPLLSFDFARAVYDPASDAFELWQLDPDDFYAYEHARIGGDGAILQPPVFWRPRPEFGWEIVELADGTLGAWGADFSCVSIDAYLYRWDGVAWIAETPKSLPVGGACNEHVELVADLGQGRSAWMMTTVTQVPGGTNDRLFEYLIYDGAGALESRTSLLDTAVAFPDSWTTSTRHVTDTHELRYFGTLSGTTDAELHLLSTELQTGASMLTKLVGPLAGRFDSPIVTESTGDTVAAFVRRGDADFNGLATHFVTVQSDGTQPLLHQLSAVTLYPTAASASPAGVTVLGAHDGLVTVDTDGVILEQSPFGFSSAHGLAPFVSGFEPSTQSHRWLVPVFSRVLVFPGQCEP